jgi:predicted RNA-binding protein with PUA-like domain
MAYWLLKSEPTVYSLADLQQEGETLWDGVRNFQARNYLRLMQIDDQAFFYHSNTQPPGIVGRMQVVATQVVDPTQFLVDSPYYDAKATHENPRWWTVKLKFLEVFPQMVTLDQLKQAFADTELAVVRRGNRLSVMPVADSVADRILTMVAANDLLPS